ncbi:MAG: ATP-dependent 6-phosphofructokinase [Acidobacteriota bacterium]
MTASARQIKRIAINTGGGDAPGLNAVIRAVTEAALERGWEIFGIRKGFHGLLDIQSDDDLQDPQRVIRLDADAVHGIGHLGGTILGTTNSGNPFEFPMPNEAGELVAVDRSDEIMAGFERLGVDALVAIGGDGSMRIAQRFADKGLPIVGVPKTIDNDLNGTVVTFGFDTAVTVATAAIDRLHSTAESHERVMVVEVMGRYAGWIALHAGLAGSADVILLPEVTFSIDAVIDKINSCRASSHPYAMVVVAEGAAPIGGAMTFRGAAGIGHEGKLGGIGEQVAQAIRQRTAHEVRTVVLGHLQRGGSPTARDRLIAYRFGAAAVRALASGYNNVMVALDPPNVRPVPLADATARMKSVPLDGDTIKTVRDLEISLGELPPG